MSALFKLFLLSCALFQFSKAAIDPSDQAVLINFYNSLTSKGSLNWDTTADLCGQDGVSCYGPEPQRVGQLNVQNKGLKGTFPTSLVDLPNLSYLLLSQNEFSGQVPKEVGLFENLYEIDLGTNKLTGTIPTQFANVTSLKKLTLYNNQLTGTIPTEFTDITYLSFGANQLTGTFPTQIGNIFNLTGNAALSLRNNRLSGPIPAFISDVSAYIISLEYNYWDCPIPFYTASYVPDYYDTKADCDASCPANRCQTGETCSMRKTGGYYCCPTGTSCANAAVPSCTTIANENNIIWKGKVADGEYIFGECVSGYAMDDTTFIQRPCIQTGSTATWGPTHGTGVCQALPGTTPTPTHSSANSVKIGIQLILALSFLVLLLVV